MSRSSDQVYANDGEEPAFGGYSYRQWLNTLTKQQIVEHYRNQIDRKMYNDLSQRSQGRIRPDSNTRKRLATRY